MERSGFGTIRHTRSGRYQAEPGRALAKASTWRLSGLVVRR